MPKPTTLEQEAPGGSVSLRQMAAATRQKNHDDVLRWLLRDMTRRLDRIDSRLDRLAARRVARS